MDALLTLIPIQNTIEHNGVGDFYCTVSGQIERRGSRKTAPYVYAGIQILKTDRLTEIPEKAFSLNVLWNTMIAEGRAFGMVHSYPWVDVGTPKGLLSAEKVLKNV